MLVKIHKAEDKKIVAISDKNLIGKEFEEGEKYLEVKELFYKGRELNREKILDELRDASSANIVGKTSVKFAIDNNIIDKEHVISIEDVPCAIVIFYE